MTGFLKLRSGFRDITGGHMWRKQREQCFKISFRLHHRCDVVHIVNPAVLLDTNCVYLKQGFGSKQELKEITQ
jgi:hypothetical protein